jgi:hypothetical protein
MSPRPLALLLAACPVAVAAQSPPADSTPPRVLPVEQQVAAAVSPAPEGMRAAATVLGFTPDLRLTTLRAGTNDLICLADDPARPGFHAACYHKELEAFMARGRALRARGMKPEAIDSVRLADVKRGRLRMPTRPTALYQLFAPADSVDATTGAARGARPLWVMYIPYATAKSTGLSTQPIKGPWLMDAGLPWAHIMYTP